MNLNLFVLLLIFIHAGFDIYSQTIDETVKTADELFENGDFNNSLTMYQRALYFSKDRKFELNEKIGDIHYLQDNFQKAIIYYDSAFLSADIDSSEIRILYKKVDLYLIDYQYDNAMSSLGRIAHYSFYDKQKLNFYYGLVYFLTEEYKSSKRYFLLTVCDTCYQAKNEIDSILSKKIRFSNAETAIVLSSVMPGLGQIYSGNYKQALNSFVLLGIITFIMYDMYIKFGLKDPLINIYPWFSRYFKGGMYKAESYVYKKLNQKRNDKLNKLIKIVNANSK
jgi:tetratricopeptide (TPR) repeat protein